MTEMIKVNKKVVNDPLYTPVMNFLKRRIAQLEESGPEAELALAKARYTGLLSGDVMIESAVTFPDGVVRVCMVSRKTGFARVDIDITRVPMDDILTDFGVARVEIEDVDHLKEYAKAHEGDEIKPTLLWLKDQQTYGVLLTQEQAKTHAGPMSAFGELFFENYTMERESEHSIDWESLQSGTLTITDPSFGRGVYPLFIYELVLSEAQLPEITSNLPLEITSRRGGVFTIPNTYWFAGTQDITQTATVGLSTVSGYADLGRSSDLLQIDGETIYGSAEKEILDELVVRVTYDWNGRLVHKNFRIKLTIEKDPPSDLQIIFTPTDITATNGDTVEVSAVAMYKGELVEILLPPGRLASRKNWGGLNYVRTKPDLTMIYRGRVSGAEFPPMQEQVTDLWSEEFSYNDSGKVVKATGLVNAVILKPEVVPTFSLSGVRTLLQGYKGAEGVFLPVAKYGDTDVPITEFTITQGVMGSKELVELGPVDEKGVHYKLIKDSEVPSLSVRDTFTQTYEWIDPRGVVQSKSYVTEALVKLDSIVEIIPKTTDLIRVKRYQTGSIPFSIKVNGTVDNSVIRAVSVASSGDINKDYIRTSPGSIYQWWVPIADTTREVTYEATFNFSALIDGVMKNYSFKQIFIVEKYVAGTGDGSGSGDPGSVPKPPVNDGDPTNPGGAPAPGETGTGPGGYTGPMKPIGPGDPGYDPDNPENPQYLPDPTAPGGDQNPDSPGKGEGPYNAEIRMVPVAYTISGNSDKNYQFTFKVYNGSQDVTATAEIMTDYTVYPEFARITGMSYVAADNVFRVTYTKDKGGVSQGAIFAKLKANAEPTKQQIARLWLNVDIVQMNVLKVTDGKAVTLDVDKSGNAPLTVEFAGKALSVNDPALTIEVTDPDVRAKITDIQADGLVLLNNTWVNVGVNVRENLPLKLSYLNPEDNVVYEAAYLLGVITRYPRMELIYTGEQEISAEIWDTGTFPIKLMAGDKDWTSAITTVQVVTGADYIKTSKLNWEVAGADAEPSSQIVGLGVRYVVGQSGSGELPADFKFNLGAWDGITFRRNWVSTDTVNGLSGTTGVIEATFLYKGQDCTDKVSLVKAKSQIPETVELGAIAYDQETKTLKIPYTLKLGGEFPMSLVFAPSMNTAFTDHLDFTTAVEWLDQINVINIGKDVRGFWNDQIDLPLVINCKGVPIPLDDAGLELGYSSGENNPIELVETKEGALSLLLSAGGELGTTYNYTITLNLVYTNPEGKVYNKTLEVPASIRVSAVKVGANPTISGNVFDTGQIPVALVDERGRKVPITRYGVSGAGSNVISMDPDIWYITSGSELGPVEGELPLRLWYVQGGKEYSIDVTEKFNIAKWDGIFFKADTDVVTIDGAGGDTDVIPMEFVYQGFATTNVRLDRTRSKIPDVISVSDLDKEGNLTYTLAGNDTGELKLCFVYGDAGATPVEGRDMAYVIIAVKTKSSNLPFVLNSSDSAVSVDWSKEATIKLEVTYGGKVVPNNAPGLVFSLGEAETHGISVVGATADGITIKGTRSSVPGTTEIYPETIIVKYEVGAPEPKTVSFDVRTSVVMGVATVAKNDKVTCAIWDKKSFTQTVMVNDTPLPTVDHYELTDGENTYIEQYAPSSYEVIAADQVDSTQTVPMAVYFAVDTTTELQKLAFDATFEIKGSNSVRFKAIADPLKVEGALDVESKVTVRPVYKDKNVGGLATFKPALSKIPAQLTLKEYRVSGNYYEITFVGAKAGLAKMDLVFWSPDAGTEPKSRDVATASVDVKVMGELGIEIGARSNLLTGKDGDTGVYNFEILFGGIPVDIPAEMANGNLKLAVEKAPTTSMNALVLNVDNWQTAAFEYHLSGVVAPGQAVNVSDFINVTYLYGGTQYSRRVEIPLKYTSGDLKVTLGITDPVKMFAKGTVAPKVLSGTVDISSTLVRIQNTDEDQYITWTNKQYEVIDAETTQIVHAVPSRLVGQYRNWAYAAATDIEFTIAAWNQQTWDVTHATSLTQGYETTTKNLAIFATYRGAAAQLGNTPVLDLSRSELGGLVTASYFNTPQSTQQNYTITLKKPAKDKVKFCWVRPGAPTPGVEGQDYTFTYLDVDIIPEEITIELGSGGNSNITAANGDTINNASLLIKRKSDGLTLGNNYPTIKITVDPTDLFQINSFGTNTINITMTVDPTKSIGLYTTPLTVVFHNNATGRDVTGTFNYPITVVRPSDYPTFKLAGPYSGNTTNKLTKLWEFGGNPYIVKTGTTDISNQCELIEFVTAQSGTEGSDRGVQEISSSVDFPIKGTWWQQTKAFNSSSSLTYSLPVTVKMRVPYRGKMMDVQLTNQWIPTPTTNNVERKKFRASTTLSKIPTEIGMEIEVPVKIEYRGYKYGEAVFSLQAHGNPDIGVSGDYFDLVKSRYDDTTGLTYVTLKAKKTVPAGATWFMWDLKDASATPVFDEDRCGFTVQMYAAEVTDLKRSARRVWDNSPNLSTIMQISVNGTNITSQCKVLSISNPNLVVAVDRNNPSISCVSSTAIEAFSGDVEYSVQLPSTYDNRVMKVVIPTTIDAYDGVEFKIESAGSTSWPFPSYSGRFNSIWMRASFRGASIAQYDMGTKVISNTVEIQALNAEAHPDNRLTYGGFSYVTPANTPYMLLAIYNAMQTYQGDIIIPLHYKGPGYDEYPVGTLGKNYALYTVKNAIFYDDALYPFPSDYEAPQLTGSFGDTVYSAIKSSAGKDIAANVLPMNYSGVNWSLPTSLSKLITKPASNPSDSGGLYLKIDYDNRGDDLLVEVPIKVQFVSSQFRGYPFSHDYTYIQKVLIKGTQQGNTVQVTPLAFTRSLVWDVSGPAVRIVHNGSTIAATAIKDIQIADNPYIRRPEEKPDTSSRWFEIYNGTKEGVTTTATFTVTYTDGLRDYTVSQDVPITIQPYSGSPWNVIAVTTDSPSTTYNPNGLTTQRSSGQTLYLRVTYKNKVLDSTTGPTLKVGVDTRIGEYDLPGFYSLSGGATSANWYNIPSPNYNAGWAYNASVRSNATDMHDRQMGRVKFGFTDKFTDPNAVEGIDWVWVTVPCFVYEYNRTYVSEYSPSTFKGKYGDGIVGKIVCRLHLRNQYITLMQAGYGLAKIYPNLTFASAQADQNTTVSFLYNSELNTEKELTTDIELLVGTSYGNTYADVLKLKGTQISNLNFPTVVDVQRVETSLNATGDIPFRVVDGNNNDITSTVTIRSIVANDYIEFVNGKWRCKDTRSGDTEVKVTFAYTLVYEGKALYPFQDVTFVIKPVTEQPIATDVQVVNGKVWDNGYSLPFKIQLNGSEVPISMVKSVSGSSVNGRVDVRASKNFPYKIIAGDLTKAVSDTATFTVTIETPNNTLTVTQDVVFNIEKYDGIEFKLKVRNIGAGNAEGNCAFIPYNTTGSLPIYVDGYYRGDQVIKPVSVDATVTGDNSMTVYGVTAGLQYNLYPKSGVRREVRYLTVTVRRDASAGTVPNIDQATITIPVYLTVGSYNGFLDPFLGTTEVTGKYRDQVPVDAHIMLYASNANTASYMKLTTSGMAISFTPANVIEMVPGSLTDYGFKVRFVNNKFTESVDNVAVKVTYGTNITVDYTLKVTQKASEADKPDVDNLAVQTVGVNQSGGIPFTLTDPDSLEDVTSTASITSLSTNDYVELVNGKWRVKKDVQAETSVTVTFNLAMNYRGKDIVVTQDVSYLVKPFAGNFGIVDQKEITANVWDRGTELPFTLTINGNPFPVEWITGYSALPSNDKVTIGSNGLWQIVAGDATQAISTTVGYGVRVTAPGGVERVAIPMVKFTINQYDGVEFKLQITNLSATGDIVKVARKDGYNSTPATPSDATIMIQGTYRGDIITASPGFTVKELVDLKNMSALGLASGTGATKNFTAALTSTALVKALNVVRMVRAGATGTVEGVDVVTLTLPITTYVQDTLQVAVLPDPIVGKAGDELTVTADVRYNGQKRKLNDTGYQTSIGFNGSTPMEIIAGSVTENDFKVRFKADVGAETSGKFSFAFSTMEYPATQKTVYKQVGYTQKPVTSVELTEVTSPLTMDLWESKALSFKVMSGTTDITSSATSVETTNAAEIGDKFEFAKLSDTTWGYKSIKGSSTEQVTATATFNVNVTYNGKDYVVPGSVNLVTNINDSGIPADRFSVELL